MPRQSALATAAARPALEQSALLLARQLVDRTRALYRELEQRTGAPVAMHRALAGIAADPGIQASRLAQLLGLQRSALSHLLKALATRGWIERRRSDADQRSVQLYVTPAGRSIVNATSGRVAGILQRAVRQLEDRDLLQLQRSLQMLLRHIQPAAPAAVTAARARTASRSRATDESRRRRS